MTRRDLERKYADKSTTPLPPADQLRGQIRTCDCGGAYLNIPAGHDSHEIVFGHRPHTAGPPTNPAGRGTSPAEHQSAAPQQPGVPDGIGRARDPTTNPGHNDDRDDDRR